MLIVVDIGNTNIVIGLYKGDQLKDHFRIASRKDLTVDETGFFISGWLSRMHIENEMIDDVIICSVVPHLTTTMETTAKTYLGCIPTIVNHKLSLPITIDIDQPSQLGADRIANAAAGFKKFGGPVIVVDFGTATTFDIVNEKGTYIGGVIIPGPETSMEELAKKAARLFEIRIKKPEKTIGRSTKQALESGLFHGTIGQVDYIIDKIIEEAGFKSCTVAATGGFARGIEGHTKHIKHIEPTLTLEGLKLISEMN